jgi:hypothetical protein
MIGRDSTKDFDLYGIWPWLGGVALSAGLIWLMFALARGFG